MSCKQPVDLGPAHLGGFRIHHQTERDMTLVSVITKQQRSLLELQRQLARVDLEDEPPGRFDRPARRGLELGDHGLDRRPHRFPAHHEMPFDRTGLVLRSGGIARDPAAAGQW